MSQKETTADALEFGRDYTSKSDHSTPLSSSIPLSSNRTPSSPSSFSFDCWFCPLGASSQSPLKPPRYCHAPKPCQPHLARAPKPEMERLLTPVLAMQRWHGTSGANGFTLSAPPTAR